MKKFILLSVLTLFFTSCEEGIDAIPEEEIAANLEGEWEWISSSGGLIGWTIAPMSSNQQGGPQNDFLRHTLTFNNDFTALVKVDNDSENGLSIRHSAFRIEFDPNSLLGDYPQLVYGENLFEIVPDIGGVVDFFMNPAIISLDEDTLILQDNCTDCYQHVFRRVGSGSDDQ